MDIFFHFAILIKTTSAFDDQHGKKITTSREFIASSYFVFDNCEERTRKPPIPRGNDRLDLQRGQTFIFWKLMSRNVRFNDVNYRSSFLSFPSPLLTNNGIVENVRFEILTTERRERERDTEIKLIQYWKIIVGISNIIVNKEINEYSCITSFLSKNNVSIDIVIFLIRMMRYLLYWIDIVEYHRK